MLSIKLICVLSLVSASAIAAQGADNGTPPPNPVLKPSGTDAFRAAKSDEDYTGKRFRFPVQITATVSDAPAGKDKVCIPAKTRLRGLSKLTSAGVLVRLRAPEDNDGFKTRCEPEADVPLDKAYGHALVVNATDVDTLPVDMNGLSYGLLFVPFKYHLSGSKSFGGSGSVGPYVGWKQEVANQGASIEYAGFVGLSSVKVEQNIDGKKVDNDLAAFSYGVALIGRIRKNFQVGLVLGADRVGKDATYIDNGKAWIAVSIGYAFSQ